MGKRKKKRTHTEEEEVEKVPRCFVMKRGAVGKEVRKLVEDMRRVMYPNTAMNLKESRRNNLRDFVHVAGPLGVTHMLAYSATDWATYLKVARLPRGPTLTFAVRSFSLMQDVAEAQERPRPPGGPEYKAPPLVILSGMGGGDERTRIMSATFQSMFPTLNVTKVRLADAQRCVLFLRDPDTGEVHFRHYFVDAEPAEASSAVRTLVSRKKSLDLRHLQDVAQLFQSGNGDDGEEGTQHVTLCSSFFNTKKDTVPRGKKWKRRKYEMQREPEAEETEEQFRVRLVELGPRMTLDLTKVEQDLFTGEVLYHAFVKKSKKEVQELRDRASEKARRRMEQEKNVARKKAEAEEREKLKQEKRARRGPEGGAQRGEGHEDEGSSSSSSSSSDSGAEDIGSDAAGAEEDSESDDGARSGDWGVASDGERDDGSDDENMEESASGASESDDGDSIHDVDDEESESE